MTGPNAQGCFECHEQPFEDGSGTAALNVHRDPFRTGNLAHFIQRNTPHVFAAGAIQRLAEEMTDQLANLQDRLVRQVCDLGGTREIALVAKGVSFGTLGATRTRVGPCGVSFITDGVRGIDFLASVDNPDAPPLLIVRPFQWKGSVAFLRDFNRGASNNELGMQAVEIVGDDVDGDHDGMANELTIGDQTALVTIDRPIFSEPSQNAAYRDGEAFPAGQLTAARGLDPRTPVTFDLTRRDSSGRGIVELYGDLKRHVMGPNLAEPVNEIAGDDVTPIPDDPRNRHTPDTFLTENLWGVGSTAPYMHDGRATTLAEAILEHATADPNDPSEAAASRRAYLARTTADKRALIAFLENLVIFKLEEEVAAAGGTALMTSRGEAPVRRRAAIGPRGFMIVGQ